MSRAAALLLLALLPGVAARAGEPPRVRSLPTADGGAVTAHEWGRGTHAVVLVHGAAFGPSSWERQAKQLAERGLRVLALDMRRDALGRPRPPEVWRLDVRAAIEALRADGAREVSVVGASIGGAAVADCLTEEPIGAVERVVLLSPAGARRPERLPGRKLVVLSREEPSVEAIRQLYARMPGPKELAELDGAAHAQRAFRGPAKRVLEERLVRFLAGAP
jgi:pimeloyl-ACP methyl ester carboxylesterase